MTRSTEPVGRTGPVRPSQEVGAMTRAMNAARDPRTGPRTLRVAMVRDGKVVAEHRTQNEDVTIGTSTRAHFTVASGPERHALFVFRRGALRLDVPRDAEAKVTPAPIDDVLSADARGRIKFSDGTTVLFQRIPTPPVVVRAQLPSVVRGGFSGNVDWTFTAFVVATAMLMTGFLIALENHDWPIENTLASQIRNFEAIFEEPPMPEPPDDEWAQQDPPDDDDEVVATNEDEPTESREAPTTREPRNARRSPADRAAEQAARIAQATAEAEAQILLLGARLDNEAGAFRDLVGAGAPIAEAAEVMRQVDGVSLHASNDRVVTRSAENRGNRCIGTRCLGARGRSVPMEREAGMEIVEQIIRTRVSLTRAEPLDPGEFDDQRVIRRVRGKRRAVRACYERILGRERDTRGRITIELTVQRAGNVRARAVDNSTGSSALASCITRRLNSIRFPTGPERPVDYRFPFMFDQPD